MAAAGKVPFSEESRSSDASTVAESAAAPNRSCIITALLYPPPALKRS